MGHHRDRGVGVTACEYLRAGDGADVACGRPAVAIWADGSSSVAMCQRHDERARRMAEKDPGLGWERREA